MAGLLPALLVPTTVAQSSANVPLFQFAIFYNVDLDISPGSALTIGGKTFSNGNIWICPSGQVTFQDTVACAGNYKLQSDPNGDQTANVTAFPVTPIYNFTGNGGQPLSHTGPIVLSIATNVEAILQPPPPAYAPGTAAAYETNGLVYDFNAADLIISNTASAATNGTNITVIYQNQFCANVFQRVPPDATNIFISGYTYITNQVTHTIITNTIYSTNMCYSYVTSVTFYDFREAKTNYAIQIDVARLNTWFSNTTATGGNNYNVLNSTSKCHYINSIYVYNFIPPTSTRLPCVRVINGQQLPFAGLSIATPVPLYVEGNYNVQTATSAAGASAQTHNTAYTYPAAFLADAITILSSKWNDTGNAYLKGGSYSSRGAANTTINAACIEGIVVSTNFTGAPAGGCYSGGVENFLRLEENWSGDTLCYNGSIAVLFPSRYATNYWQMPGAYYGVPTRSWGFDTNYLSPTKLPPLTPLLIINTNPPVITTQPQSQTVAQGSNVTFNVTAAGCSPLSYQWEFNGTNISTATNASLTLTSVNTNNAGNYMVVITNLNGSVTSSNAILSVYASAAAMLNGCSFSCVNGFQFQVAGVPGFNYAVQESTNLIDWVSLLTNISPFIFVDANATNFPQQFYRTLYVP
ncbi:MAG: immunoglobulin domain-containing protein [Verrucomicrobiota bacterium]|jgi:hypothetical protein